jgi:hypothetical protein
VAYVKTHVVARRNARGGRSGQEHLVAALRSLYQRAVDDGLIAEADNPARKVAVLAAKNRRHTDKSGSAVLPAHWEGCPGAAPGDRLSWEIQNPLSRKNQGALAAMLDLPDRLALL